MGGPSGGRDPDAAFACRDMWFTDCTFRHRDIATPVEVNHSDGVHLYDCRISSEHSARAVYRMPGTVTRVTVAPGDEVARGAPLAVLEAMKMETEVVAPVAGAVRAVHVAEGAVVALGDPLVEIEPAEEA